MLRNVIYGLQNNENNNNNSTKLSKKKFHFALAPENISNKLTGYYHNAITPFGMLTNIPVVICSRLLAINPAYIYVGGGEVDIKLGISIEELMNVFQPIIGRVSQLR